MNQTLVQYEFPRSIQATTSNIIYSGNAPPMLGFNDYDMVNGMLEQQLMEQDLLLTALKEKILGE